MKIKPFSVLLGTLFIVATGIYATILLPPYFHEKKREQIYVSEASSRHRGAKSANAALLSYVSAQDKYIKSLPVSKAEKQRLGTQAWQAATDEMNRIEANDYKEPFGLKAP